MPQILLLAAGLVIVIFLILAFVLMFRVGEGIFRILGLAVVIIITAFLIAGFLAFFDLMDLKENFNKSENLVLFEENRSVKAAAILKNGNFQSLENYSSYNGLLENKSYKKMHNSYYKLIIIKNEALFSDAGFLNIVKEYRDGSIVIYPETFFFKLIRRFPVSGSFGIPFPNMTITKGVI